MEAGRHGEARMKILCLDPECQPLNGKWAAERWDRVVDLGFAGKVARDQWSAAFECAVETVPKLEADGFARMRQVLSEGLGHVVDQYGLDWWELISIWFHEQIELIIRLEKLAASMPENSELFVTRTGIHAEILSSLQGRSIRCFSTPNSILHRTGHICSTARNFNVSQLLRIIGDKYDAGYELRRFLTHRLVQAQGEIVLLPVAHVTAARMAVAYAAMLRRRKFLLVSTRHSGWISERPQNVAAAKLAAYAHTKVDDQEYRDLLANWRRLESDLTKTTELKVLTGLGTFANIPKLLRNGLAIRNAWLRVFAHERVSAVFCTDNTNPYTHIPLLLARRRKLPTIACHHGALDGGYLFKRSHADVVLAKGRMEWDYLVDRCAVPDEKVELGAYAIRRQREFASAAEKPSIIFFSEPYELDYGRTQQIYAEVLPRLAEMARSMNRELVVKLHPMERVRERKKLVNATLSAPQRSRVKVIAGSLSEELLERVFFAVTVQSTAAVDCTIRGIPTFLCAWLDYSRYGYLEQFVKFGAGFPLHSPSEIAELPRLLESFSPVHIPNLWQTIAAEKLDQLLTGPLTMAAAG